MICTYKVEEFAKRVYFYFPSSSQDYISCSIEEAPAMALKLKADGYKLKRRKGSKSII